MKTIWRILSIPVALWVLVLLLAPIANVEMSSATGQRSAFGLLGASQDGATAEIIVGDPVFPVLTGPVKDLPPSQIEAKLDREINPRLTLYPGNPNFDPPNTPDPLLPLQLAAPPAQPDGFNTPIFNFNGQGYTFLNPPDTVGDVGKDHYIQMINATEVAIYNKNTAALIQSFSLTSLGGCSTGNGDPVVLYDQLADRWLLSEFGPGNSLCVFISQTPNPQGAYYSYQFSTPSFPDYPKYGVWPDAYYVTTNESSPAVYALNRTAMLAGQAATSVRFTAPGLAGFGFEALTPADLDGMTPPPAGSPNYIMRHVDTEAHSVPGYPTNDILEIWAFSVNWTTPTSSTFTKIADILTAEFDSTLCGLTSFYCMGMPGVPQGSTSSLDPLREVIMHRLGYRNFGSHQTLVGNFVTDIGSNIGGIRWFELRKVGAGPWTLYQEGTYAPTTNDNRWMGGIAMDGSGNIALGYNVSSQTIYPSIRYAGRLASDPLGTLPQGEYTLVNGSAINGSNRYGDYSAMSIDPIDDCTFWFTGQWNDATQWKTRIGAFRFDACGSTDFTLSAEPATQDVCVGTDALYAVTIGSNQGFADPVALSATGQPVGATAVFTPNNLPAPYTSTLTIGGTTPAMVGSYEIEITGIAPTSTHTTTVQLNLFDALANAPALVSPANGALNVSIQPTFSWNSVPGSTAYLVEIATDVNFSNIVLQATVPGTSYTPATNLASSTLYYWRVTASNVCGSSAPSAPYIFVTEAQNLVCNPTAITIPSSGPGTPYPSNINVAGFGPSLSDVNVHLLNLSHTWPDDIDILLVGPQGQNLIIMSDVGGSIDLVNVDLILDDAAANVMPDAGPIVSGTYKPTNVGTGDTFPAPAPAPSTATQLSVFNGTNPNGTWSLYLVDDAAGDTGTMAGGWCLELAVPSAGNASIALTKTVGIDPYVYPTTNVITVTSGTEVTYFYVVENTGTLALPLHTLADSALGTLLGPNYPYTLNPGQSVMITATATIVAPVTNVAIWQATDGVGNSAAASSQATVNVSNVAITLEKTVGTEAGVCASTSAIDVVAGTTVYYCYTVTNVGGVMLSLHDLVDDQMGTILSGFAYDLMPGASVNTVAAGLTISSTIMTTTVNTAVWTAYNDPTETASATASATVTVVNPAIRVSKTVGTEAGVCASTNEIDVLAGTAVYYCYTVTNIGDVTLSLHDLVDDELGTILDGFAYNLLPGASVNTVAAGLTISSTIMTTTVNTAVWTAYNDATISATAEATATVNVVNPAIRISKTVGTDADACATTSTLTVEEGTVVYYCYTVTNIGDVTLSLHDLVDDQLGTILDGFAYNLLPGASVNTVAAGLTISSTIMTTTVNTAVWTAYNDATISATAEATATVNVRTGYFYYLPIILQPEAPEAAAMLRGRVR